MSTKTFSYDAGTLTCTAKGGSYTDPITLTDMDGDATIGGYFSTSGENSKVYTCDKNLVLGDDSTATYFRIAYSEVLKFGTDRVLTLHISSLQNAFEFADDFWSKYFGNFVTVDSDSLKIKITGIRQIHWELKAFFCPVEGILKPLGQNGSALQQTQPTAGPQGYLGRMITTTDRNLRGIVAGQKPNLIFTFVNEAFNLK